VTAAWEVRQGDARMLLASLPERSVDAIVTDPPYGERAAGWDRPRSIEWHVEWMGAAEQVLKAGAPLVTFASRRYLDVVMGAMRRVFGDESERPLQTGVWIHRQGFTGGRKGSLRPEHEPWIASGLLRAEAADVRALRRYSREREPVHRQSGARGFKPFTYTPNADGPMGGTVFESPRNAEERTEHPTQKPEAVIAYLVALACVPGGLVVDPFVGSGTCGVVALRSGRRFIGCDQSARYCAIARRRIAGPLFAETSA